MNTCRFSPSAALFFLHCLLWSSGSAHFSPPQRHNGTFWTFKHRTQVFTAAPIFPHFCSFRGGVQSEAPGRKTAHQQAPWTRRGLNWPWKPGHGWRRWKELPPPPPQVLTTSLTADIKSPATCLMTADNFRGHSGTNSWFWLHPVSFPPLFHIWLTTPV